LDSDQKLKVSSETKKKFSSILKANMNEDLQNLTYPKKSAIDDYWTKDLDKVYIKNPDTESNFSKGKSSTETQIPLRTIRWV